MGIRVTWPARPAVRKGQLNLEWACSPKWTSVKRTGRSADWLGQAWRQNCQRPSACKLGRLFSTPALAGRGCFRGRWVSFLPSWAFRGFPLRPSLLVLGFRLALFLSELVSSQTCPLRWYTVCLRSTVCERVCERAQ